MIGMVVVWMLYPNEQGLEPIVVFFGLIGSVVGTVAAWLNPTLSGISRDEVFERIADSNPTKEWTAGARMKGDLYYYRWDSNLRIERVHSCEGRGFFHEPWAMRFPDQENVWIEDYYLMLGTTPIESFRMVVVDGGRAIMPLPKSSSDLRVTRLQYVLAKVFDQLGTLDDYMHLADFTIVEEATLKPSK